MGVLDTFVILFESDASKLDQGLKDSDQKANSLASKLANVDLGAENLGKSFLELVNKGAGLLGIGLSFAAITASIKSTAAEAEKLEKLAKRFNTTVDAIDEFADAGELLGLSNEQTIGGLTALDAAVQDTAMGMGRAKVVFEELGISVKDAAGKVKPTTTVMAELADKMKDMEQGKKIRVMERLGLDPALMKVFNADMQDLRKRMNDIDNATGFSIDEMVKRSGAFTKASKGLSLEVKSVGMYLEKMFDNSAIKLMPIFTAAMEKASEIVNKVFNFLMRHGKFAEGILIAIGSAIAFFLLPSAISAAIAIWTMVAPFLAVAAIVAVVGGAFALLYDDIMNFIEGNDSLIGQMAEKYPIVKSLIDGIAAAFVWMKDAALITIDALIAGFGYLGEGVSFVFDGMINNVMTLISWVQKAVEFITGLASNVTSAVKAVGGFLGFGGNSGTAQAVEQGQQQIAMAANNPITSQTSNSISNAGPKTSNKNTNVQVGSVVVNTQATDADGVARAVGGTLNNQLRQTVSNYDDGVLA